MCARSPFALRDHRFDCVTLASPPISESGFQNSEMGIRWLQLLRNNNKRQSAMFKDSKVRQAGLIVFATTLLLILPNLNRLFG
jgi:hypothetical protein